MKRTHLFQVGITLVLVLGVSLSAWADCHPADLNCDGCIEIGELMQYIECWYRGECPLDKLFEAIEMWFGGCPGGSLWGSMIWGEDTWGE